MIQALLSSYRHIIVRHFTFNTGSDVCQTIRAHIKRSQNPELFGLRKTITKGIQSLTDIFPNHSFTHTHINTIPSL